MKLYRFVQHGLLGSLWTTKWYRIKGSLEPVPVELQLSIQAWGSPVSVIERKVTLLEWIKGRPNNDSL